MRAIILIVLFFSQYGFGKDISVEDGNRKYKISFYEKSISYSDEATVLNFSKRDCNAHIIERINKRLNHFLEKPFLEDSRPEFLKIKMDGKTVYEPRFGERAVYFIQMNQEIKKLKVEESLNCQKN